MRAEVWIIILLHYVLGPTHYRPRALSGLGWSGRSDSSTPRTIVNWVKRKKKDGDFDYKEKPVRRLLYEREEWVRSLPVGGSFTNVRSFFCTNVPCRALCRGPRTVSLRPSGNQSGSYSDISRPQESSLGRTLFSKGDPRWKHGSLCDQIQHTCTRWMRVNVYKDVIQFFIKR